jgi:hypothetical protein
LIIQQKKKKFSRNNSSVCNSTIDNSTVCYGELVMLIVTRTDQNQIMTKTVGTMSKESTSGDVY